MRVPNRCWIKQSDGGDEWHRENRVVARAVVEREPSIGYGETHCGLKLRGDRTRRNDRGVGKVCLRCQRGNYEEYRFAGRNG